ncbi:MAG: diguanylate cyclase [Proteobacteria bacterium]|nr:diguanylate cyclase [Pseudomonadota bacterium]
MTQGRILIIDDDEVDRKAARRALERSGWNGVIATAENAQAAMAQLHAERFDCILLDYRLPGQDGLDLLQQLGSTPGMTTPIVMLTGEGNEMIAVEAMKRGAFDYLPKSQLAPDTLYRIVAQALENARLQQALADAQAQLERQALYDILTNLGNRNLFRRDLTRSIASAQRSGKPFGLMVMDLDKFKAANDQFGHDAGDSVLAEFGRRVLAVGRANDAFYRLGGDEFTALIEACDAGDTPSVAERIRSAVSAPFQYTGQTINIGVSIGIAIFPKDGSTEDSLLKAADNAMYRAKRTGTGIAAA